MDVYKYSPLKADLSEIRVLSLLPGDFESPIIISMSTAALIELGTITPFPEALSYVWGPLNQRHEIIVKGNEDGRLSITTNLAEALKYLRSSTKARLLWVDAICINQQDLEERSSQIRLMGQIYSSARRVMVWVGPKSEDSDLAIDCITTIASRIKVNFQTAQLSPITEDTHWADHDMPLQLSDTEHTALFRFYSRSWFERIWVWQEVHLAANALVLCGDRSVNWDTVKTGVICLGLKPRPDMAEWPAPEAAFSMATFPMTKNFPLRALLHKTKDAKCLDPRDKVFALLSFLDEDMRSRIVPNYNKSAQEIYKDIVLQHFEIGHRDGPKLLSTVEARGEIPESPSWVPRWDLRRLTTRLYHGKSALETLSSIRCRSKAKIEATGVYITKINRVEPIKLWNDVGQQEVIDEIKRLKEHIVTGHGQNPYPFLETLTANYIAERHYPAYTWRPSTKDFPRFLDFVFGNNGVRDPSVDRIIKNIREFGPGRALCATTDGNYVSALLEQDLVIL